MSNIHISFQSFAHWAARTVWIEVCVSDWFSRAQESIIVTPLYVSVTRLVCLFVYLIFTNVSEIGVGVYHIHKIGILPGQMEPGIFSDSFPFRAVPSFVKLGKCRV